MFSSKSYDYVITLKRSSTYHFIDWVSQLLLLIAVISFFMLFYTVYQSGQLSHIMENKNQLILVLIVVFIFFIWFRNRTKSAAHEIPYYYLAIAAAAAGWYFYSGNWKLTALYFVVALLEKPVKVLPEIAFDENEIVFNSFPKKTYSWKELNNVVVKDGIVTIDFKNNTLIQKETDADISAEDEKEFNNFCHLQLTANS